MAHSEHNTRIRRESLSYLLLVTYVMAEDSRRGLAERGLTKARAELIWTLGERQPLTQRELAALLRVTPRNITTLIDALEATGFVRRDEHPTDRRASAVVLTAQGKKSLAGLQADYAMLADLLFRGISKEDLRVFSRVARLAATRLQAAQP